MKKANKFLSVFLALIMTISIIPMSIITAGAEESATSGTCGENVYWTFDESTGTLTISGSGAMDNYTGFNRPWEDYEDSIEIAVINNGVTTIGYGAFADCDSLTSVTIPDSVTTICDYAFSWCDSLTSVTIPDSVTIIATYAFSWCTSLTSVTIPDSVTTIGDSVFWFCTSLTSITVDSDNEYYSNDEYGVLFNKDKTTLIQYPIGNTRTSYTIPDSVTAISGAFSNCNNLTSLTIGDSVTTIGSYAFSSCDSLTSVTMGNSVTTIGESSFSLCSNLTSIIIPDSVTTIESGAFNNCTALTDVYYSGTEEEWNAIEIGEANESLLNATIHFNDNEPDCIIGDVNEDGRINTLDRVILTRYIAKWEEYPEGSINITAADVNGDGKINTLDRVILTRYIAKWEGYETLPYKGKNYIHLFGADESHLP